METENPYGAVYDVLREIVASRTVPAGAKGRLFAAYDRLVAVGDAQRAQLCGSASVALLKLEQALRTQDTAKAEWQAGVIRKLFDIWQSIPLADVGLFPAQDTDRFTRAA